MNYYDCDQASFVVIILTEYQDSVTEKLDAITFDHYMTLFRQKNEAEEDIMNPIMRSLQDQIEFDENQFMSVYLELDKKYRKSLKETFVETTLDTIILNAFEKIGHDQSQLAKIVEISVDVGLVSREIIWFDDAQDTLNRLLEQGYTLGLISNTHWRWLPELYDKVKPFFEVITLSYEHGFAKPSSSIFHTTTAKLNVNPEKCLHIGDDPFTDIIGAKRAGMKTAHIRRSKHKSEADIEINKLSEIFRYL